jgi:hypothetical protein
MEQDDEIAPNLTPPSGDEIFGYMADKVKIIGGIVGPITPPVDWECASNFQRRLRPPAPCGAPFRPKSSHFATTVSAAAPETISRQP